MKPRLLPTISLLAVILAACAPSQATQPSAPPVAVLPSATPFQPVNTVEVPATQPPVATEAPAQAPLSIATSRGPELHATDPATVSLASGQYQFVEFFRYT
jgi:hypothetical protein